MPRFLPPFPLMLCACQLWACHEVNREQPAQTASAQAPKPAPAVSGDSSEGGPSGEVVSTLELSTGARLKLPESATAAELGARARLPEEVEEASVYHLGHERRVFMVNDMSLGDRSCAQVLKEQLAKSRQAQRDSDVRRLALRQVAEVEQLEIDGHRVLFTESKHKGFGSEARERPFVDLSSVTLCRDDTYVVLMYASDQPPSEGSPREVLLDVVRSFQPPTK